MSNTTFKVEKVKDRWTVFSIVCWGGKTFKNWVGDATTKAAAEAILRKASQSMEPSR